MEAKRNKLVEVQHIKKIFRKDGDQELLVLDDISFDVREGEIVALLGRSGCGKSTMLRIVAGLIHANGGRVSFQGNPVTQPVPGIAMVFQHFALMPWLTVLQNVELGLEALGIAKKERRQRALKAIDMIGLDGFESAFPRELSGGMRQRVGIARAFVVEPDVLLMDEPFSALDVLTAENLRNDILDLWLKEPNRKNSIILVTHNIEEAISLADRAIIFDSNPATVRGVMEINLKHPRDEQSAAFRKYVDDVYRFMTTEKISVTPEEEAIALGYRLPDANVSELSGLMEILSEEFPDKTIDLPHIADELSLDIDDLLSLTEVLDILEFAEESDGHLTLTDAGRRFAKADMLNQKKIFAKHLLEHVPLANYIHQALLKEEDHRVAKKRIAEALEDYLSDAETERVLRLVIEWGRYAELFAYDDKNGELNLENPE